MANNYNHMFDTPDYRFFGVHASSVIDIGDMVFFDEATGTVVPYGDRIALGDLPRVAMSFAGVALQPSALDDDYEIKVGVRGVYGFALSGERRPVVGACVRPIGPQVVTLSNEPIGSVGYVYRKYNADDREILIDIYSMVAPPCPPQAIGLALRGVTLGSRALTRGATSQEDKG